jgi:vanillate O-demethylase monooxygenase subunit
MAAHYEFGSDNLMDLSHIEFVHKGSFAGAGVIFAGEHSVQQDGATLHSVWWMPKVRAPSHTAGVYPPDLICDHWLEMRWHAPASMYLQIGSVPAGQPREDGVVVHQAHILTPESAGTTHYFWASTYAVVPGQPDMAPMLKELLGQAFAQEDKPMIEAAYANLEGADFWDQAPVSLGIDQGGARARRLIQAMLEAERRGAGAP